LLVITLCGALEPVADMVAQINRTPPPHTRRPPSVASRQGLGKLLRFLQGDDLRMIRRGTTENAMQRQLAATEAGAGAALVAALRRESPKHTEHAAYAAEALAWLATNHSQTLQEIGETDAITHLLDLVLVGCHLPDNKNATRASEAAAEALAVLGTWPSNLKLIINERGIQALTELLTRGATEKAQMWAGAALAALAGDICAPAGRCSWPRTTADEIEYDGRHARHVIAKEAHGGRAVRQAVHLLHEGAVGLALPGEAYRHIRHKRGLSGWAAASLLNNLALSMRLHPTIIDNGGLVALQALHESGDWLERQYTSQALQKLKAVVEHHASHGHAEHEL